MSASDMVAGAVAAVAALAVTELLAGLVEPAPSLLVGVGDVVVDAVPGSVERAAISWLGTADKPVLVLAIVVVSALLGAGVGRLARRRSGTALAAIGLAAGTGALAAAADPRVTVLPAVAVAVVGWLVAATVLQRLLQAATPPVASGPDRRTFLLLAGGALGVAGLAGVTGWLLSGRDRLADVRRAIRLPVPARSAPPPPPGADLRIAGLAPLFTANEDFYRIDTALRVPPVVDLADWRLEVRGRVRRPFTLGYDELLALPHVEADITLVCVSNEVGGDLVGNARWQGVPLAALLQRAGVERGGDQLLSRSVDGFSAGFPTRTALEVPGAMVAVAMNGVPLPPEHGFPARLVVPGLYGYVSATKWLSVLELTDWTEQGYWVPRGWAREGPVKTQARIDVPAVGAVVRAGRRVIAGVAWAPGRGISQVEVRLDDGPWTPTDLAPALSDDCWRQWHLPWEATPGVHRITARATDGRGQVQTGVRTPVAPDGASGHPFLVVRVEA